MKLNTAFLALALAIASVSTAAPLPSTVDGEGHVLDERALAAVGEIAAKAGSKLGSSFGRGGAEAAGAAGKTSMADHIGNAAMIGSMAMPFMNNNNGKRSLFDEDFQRRAIGESSAMGAAKGKGPATPPKDTPPSTPSVPSATTPDLGKPLPSIKGNAYQEDASKYNNAWGMTNNMGTMVAAGINLNTSEQNQNQRRSEDGLVDALQRRGGAGAAAAESHEMKPLPKPPTSNAGTQSAPQAAPANAFKPADDPATPAAPKYKSSDLFSSGNQMFGTAAMGMNIATAVNNNNAAQRRSVDLERRLGPWALPAMMLSSSSVDVSNQKVNEQSVGNGNQHVSGTSSGAHRRSTDDEDLSKRLFSVGVSHYDTNEQSVGNGNMYKSGATSGFGKRLFSVGVSNYDTNEQSVGNGNYYHSGATSGFGKRLFNIGVSHYNTNEQSVGNENMYKSGATSGFKRSPLGPWALPAMMLSSSSVDVSNQKVNEQSVGNGNVHVSGASSGAHRRSVDDENLVDLQRRLFSFSDNQESLNEQSVDNGNEYESGAHSGFGKRLVSVSTTKQDQNAQSVGNGNAYHSGATSGFNGVPPAEAMKMMNAGTAMGLPGKKRLVSVSTTKQDVNEQSVGNGNQYHSGATSGFSGASAGQAMKMMNAGTAMGLPA